MNPENQIPQPPPESGGGILPQTAQGASLARHGESPDGRFEFTAPDEGKPLSDQNSSLLTAHHSLGNSSSHSHPAYDDMGFVDPPEMPEKPDYAGDFDYEEDVRERELLMDDLADDNDDFARSDEEGWYYSDED